MKQGMLWGFLLLLSAAVQGEDARPVLPALTLRMPLVLDLDKALTLALDHNPGLKNLQERIREQDGRLREIRSAARPKLDLSGGYSLFDENRLQSFGPNAQPDDVRWNTAVETSTTIFSGGQSRVAIQGAEHQRRAFLDQVTTGERELLAKVQATWLDAQLARETLGVQQQAIEVFAEQLAFVRKRHEAGVGAHFDVKQAEVALANAQPPLIRAENGYRRAVDQLRMTIGLPYPDQQGPDTIRLAAADPMPEVTLDLDQAIAQALENRPEISALDARIAAQERLVIREQRRNRPLVDLFAGYGIENDQFGESDNLRGWTGGVRLNWRFSDGGATRGKVEQAQSQLRQLLHQHREIILQIEGEVRSAWFDQEEARAILVSTGLAIEEAEEALELAKNRFKAGQGTQLEVLESQLQLTRSRLEQANSTTALQRARLEIRRSAGLPLW